MLKLELMTFADNLYMRQYIFFYLIWKHYLCHCGFQIPIKITGLAMLFSGAILTLSENKSKSINSSAILHINRMNIISYCCDETAEM